MKNINAETTGFGDGGFVTMSLIEGVRIYHFDNGEVFANAVRLIGVDY